MARRIGGPGGGSDPGSGKAGAVVAAGVLAVSLTAGGGLSLGGGASTTVADSAGLNLTRAKSEGRKSARNGDADGAWRQLNMRTLKRTATPALECVSHSFGQVRDHFVRNPCKSLDRTLFAVGDDRGNVAVVSVAWVGFRNRRDAGEFKKLIDVHGTGDISPLATPLLGLADIRFSGLNYSSRTDGSTVVIAETESASGQVSGETLDAMADMASWLPR
ncbi:hypothetical protein [Lentzea flaviverrucosa]|uniref:Uncharacterized protein n=1 Tax=Lentzea flaviverrucosa TaxID=200379 RepID=A0A1H9V2J4_9PSEU|nr:hypothetical protein [Lentzea flaviverrucosa]RDI27574.1 hypothetical protein DFR72_10658 [Lentzea flaviverrucosa]SES15925.1 hypothetical protein SAMN05216195_109287 [Lentzea flaviverrucosa]